jgi:hypothetical protein
MTGWNDILATVLNALDEAAVPYMLTGSVASSYHGVPRATQDIDIVIDPTEQELEKLVSLFPEARFYVDLDMAKEAFSRRTQFNLIEAASGWKIDFIIRKKRPFNLEEFDRRMAVDLHGMKAWVAAPEDVILAKLEWAADSRSDRQIEDAAGILRRQGARLDGDYLAEWVGRLGLEPEWDKAKRFAES